MNPASRQLDAIAALLRAQSTLALATCGEDGVPAVAPLFYIPDDHLNLYWLSSPASLHSRNLAAHPEASAAVYRHTLDWKEICGVQMRGRVQALAESETREQMVKAYCQRFALGHVLQFAIRRSALYVFRPQWFRYIDNSIHFGYSFELTR